MVPTLIRRFYENKDSNEKIMVWGDGSPLREYTFAPDLARAFMWCLNNYNDAQILNVGSTEEHKIKDIAYMIADQLKIDRARLFFDTSKPNGNPRKKY
jgi:GDP-L-fucose synthase